MVIMKAMTAKVMVMVVEPLEACEVLSAGEMMSACEVMEKQIKKAC